MGLHGRTRLSFLMTGLIMLTLAGTRAEASVIRPAPRYTVTDLGDVPGGVHYEPHALNNSGEAVGLHFGEEGSGSFFYSNGVMRPGTMSPYAINDAGQGPTHPGERAINNLGQTAGSRYFPGSTARQATLTTAGETVAIHPPESFTSEAIALNDRGQVLIKAQDLSGESQSYLYDNGELTRLRFHGPGLNITAAVDINNLGQIVGHHDGINGIAQALLHEDDDFLLLGTLPGGGWTTATANNDLGQVVGNSYFESEAGTRAFLYEGGALLDLNDLIPLETGITLLDATDINDRGQILVKASREGRYRALILTPVPEPTTLATFGSIVLVICWRRREQWSKAINLRR